MTQCDPGQRACASGGPSRPFVLAAVEAKSHGSQTLHVCHICRSVGVVLGVNVGIYGIHGVSGDII